MHVDIIHIRPLSQYAPNKHHARTYTHLFYAFVSTHTFIHFSGLPFPCEAHQNAPCHAHLLSGAMPTERWPCLMRTNTHQNKHREYVIHKSGNTHICICIYIYIYIYIYVYTCKSKQSKCTIKLTTLIVHMREN